MLEALALAGRIDEALDIVAGYWGGMIDLGATTFWEDLTYEDLAKASRIDEFTPDGSYDIHADGGAHCYVGLRHSFCHGWASGPTSFLANNVLGIRPVEPGCAVVEIKPQLGRLTRIEGTFPTPHGVLKVRHTKNADGSIDTVIDAPKGVKIK